MIRAFLPFDAIAILFQSGSFPNRAVTVDNIAGKETRFFSAATLLGQWLNPQVRKCLWVWSSGLDFRGLASARNRSGTHVWEIDRLLLDDNYEECFISLLEKIILSGCESGVEKILLRLPVDSPLTGSVMKAGFLPYVTEFLYGIVKDVKFTLDTGCPHPTPRFKQIGDEYRLFELYCKCVPAPVRRFEGMTFREWQEMKDRAAREEWVFENEGALTGWIKMIGSGNIRQFELMSSSEEELRRIVWHTLLYLEGCRQLLYLTKDFQGELARILRDHGLDEMKRYAVFIKELAVKTHDPCLVPMRA